MTYLYFYGIIKHTLKERREALRVLVGCEFSGIVREAFKAKGHYALSCDLEPTEIPGLHYQGDIRDIIEDKWDMGIFFPPCTYLCAVGAVRWKEPGRKEMQQEALQFVQYLWQAPIPRIAIENPVGYLNSHWRKPDQIIQPYYFMEKYSKKTCLWLKNIPPLFVTCVNMDYENNTFVTRMPGHGKERQKARSKTFQNIALAMAEQWSF